MNHTHKKITTRKEKSNSMRKQFYILLLLVFAILLAPNGKHFVSASSLPENVRIIYNYAYIYNADENVVESTEKENQSSLIEKVALLYETYKVVDQTSKMYKIEFENDEQTLNGYIYKSAVIDNLLRSPEKYLQTNATITKKANIFKKENDMFEKVENLSLEKGSKVRLLETLSNKNKYTLISFNHENSILVYYVETQTIKADGISRSILTAITLIIVSISAGSVLFTIFKRNNKRKKQSLLEDS